MLPNLTLAHKGDILIVDDVPENLQLLFEILNEEGHEVRRVLNGKQALKAIEIDPPDLILLDIKMPIMDGYEVCTHLKADPKTTHIPVIFLSALNDVFDKVKAFSVGGVDYINKPFDVYEVLIRVDNQLKLLRSNQSLAQKNHELEILNQDLESFNYMVSHDLRRPLTKLVGFCELLQDDEMIQSEDTKETLGIILDAAQEMNQIISDLMRLAKIKSEILHIETINLSEIATEILGNLKQQSPERLVQIRIDPNIIVDGDRALFKVALENLLENAWKYTNKLDQAEIEFRMLENQVYCIRDNGAGFPMEKAADVFTPFKRLHTGSEFPGTGIGLAIVSRIIQGHQGEIWCEAEEGKGATFFFTLKATKNP